MYEAVDSCGISRATGNTGKRVSNSNFIFSDDKKNNYHEYIFRYKMIFLKDIQTYRQITVVAMPVFQ